MFKKQVSICAAFTLSFIALCAPALADRLDPEFVPPDVILPTNNTGATTYRPQANTTPAVGTTDDAKAPGMAGAASGPQQFQSGQRVAPGTPIGGPAPPPAGSSALLGHVGASGPTPTPLLPSAETGAQSNQRDPIAIMETEKGVIVIRLFRKLAPKNADNFIELVEKGFYNGLTFHRVDPGFCIQGGDPNGTGGGLYVDPKTKHGKFVNLETCMQLRHNAPGVVAMARFPKNPNTASCQFYITLSAQPKLDDQYSIFGGVISGMDVVNRIQKGDKIICVSLEQPE